ncbi:hypothetical protein C8F04DRAFT_1189984 [Mycena alexandri]|uniref:Uncharacterized protein n=1 Tax=Mycena alexandri TaxID=1745969 RepID=A0AAD6WWA9_9AGAR|nr:hypothetical protein C8F04DRAFT_1189984 [Mycena alexandri]
MKRRSQTATGRPSRAAAAASKRQSQPNVTTKAKPKKKAPTKKKGAAPDDADQLQSDAGTDGAESGGEENHTPPRDEDQPQSDTEKPDDEDDSPPPRDEDQLQSDTEKPDDEDNLPPPPPNDAPPQSPNDSPPLPPNDAPPPPPNDVPPPPPNDSPPPPPNDAPPPPPNDVPPPPSNDSPPPPPNDVPPPPPNDAPPPPSNDSPPPPPKATTTVTPAPTTVTPAPTTVTPAPTTVADPHKAPSKEREGTLDGGSWRDRHPDDPHYPGREKPPRVELTEAEKNQAALKRQLKGDKKAEYEAAVTEFDALMRQTADKLAKEFDKTPADVRKALRGKGNLVGERAHNLQNARVWKLSLEVNATRPVGTKLKAPALQKMIKEQGLFEDQTQAEQDELLAEFEESRGLKKSGTRLNNAAAARDVTAFTKTINKELELLRKRTGAIGFCAIAHSSITDTLKPACVGTEEAMKFFPQILHTTEEQFAVKFNNYGINKEVIVLGGNFEFLRKDTIARIAEGLFRAMGKHLHMKYGDYDDLLTDYGVELVGWPQDVPFQAPSVLGNTQRIRPVHEALVAGSLRWEKMSDARVAEHKEAVSKKAKKEKKERSDKGLSREEAKELKDKQPKKKRKRPDGDSTPLRVDRSAMNPEELAEHLRILNRDKKRRSRARAAGKPVPAPSRSRAKSGPPPKKKKKSREVVSDSDDDSDSSDREEEEEWVPIGGKGKKDKRAKKRKAVEESESEEDSEGERGKKTAGGKKKRAKTRHHETSDSDEEDAPHKPSSPLPFSAKKNKRYLLAMQLAADNKRTRKRRERQKEAIRSSNSPQKPPAKGPVPTPAYKEKQGTASGGGGTGGGGAGTGGAQGGTGPTLTPGASTSCSIPNPATSTNRPFLTPGASTSQLPKSLALIDSYASDESSGEDDD